MNRLVRRVFLGLVLGVLSVRPALASDDSDRIAAALLLDEVVVILHQEGLEYGRELDRDVLGGHGGAHFARRIAEIYDTSRMIAGMRDQLDRGLSPDEVDESLAFLESAAGARAMRLEASARKAVSDTAVADIAKQAYVDAKAEGDPRVDLIARFVEINQLIDHNVAGALSSNYQFFSGLSDGGGDRMSDGEILDQVWEQEAEIRTDTIDWMNGFLFLAYGPLDDADLQTYLEYSESAAGQALNRALFAGFDQIYRQIYYEIGLAVAQAMQGADL